MQNKTLLIISLLCGIIGINILQYKLAAMFLVVVQYVLLGYIIWREEIKDNYD